MSYTTTADWITRAGLRAVTLRVSTGHLCGYVGLPAGHPLHGVGYSEPHASLAALREAAMAGPVGKRGILAVFCAAGMGESRQACPDFVFNVHGSITYAAGTPDYPAASDGLWWYGFDCAHAGDTPETCTQEYAAEECESLAEQLAAVTA